MALFTLLPTIWLYSRIRPFIPSVISCFESASIVLNLLHTALLSTIKTWNSYLNSSMPPALPPQDAEEAVREAQKQARRAAALDAVQATAGPDGWAPDNEVWI